MPPTINGVVTGPLLKCCNPASLAELSLARCALTHLPPQLSRLTALTALSLQDNELSFGTGGVKDTDFEPLAALAGSLRRLDLSGQGEFLQEIPAELGTLTKLQWLNLTRTSVRRGWRVLGSLEQLTELRSRPSNPNWLPGAVGPAAEVGRLALQV